MDNWEYIGAAYLLAAAAFTLYGALLRRRLRQVREEAEVLAESLPRGGRR